jgi:hypothetical protein
MSIVSGPSAMSAPSRRASLVRLGIAVLNGGAFLAFFGSGSPGVAA